MENGWGWDLKHPLLILTFEIGERKLTLNRGFLRLKGVFGDNTAMER